MMPISLLSHSSSLLYVSSSMLSNNYRIFHLCHILLPHNSFIYFILLNTIKHAIQLICNFLTDHSIDKQMSSDYEIELQGIARRARRLPSEVLITRVTSTGDIDSSSRHYFGARL